MLANLAQASKIIARGLAIWCACCGAAADDGDGGGNSCFLVAILIWIYSWIAWLLEKIAKFLLQFVHKIILTSLVIILYLYICVLTALEVSFK